MIETKVWGEVGDEPVFLYELTNEQGATAKITNYGARAVSLEVPISNRTIDVLLGYNNLESYLNDSAYLGAIVGRYANRITDGEVIIKEEKFSLTRNEGRNHLHGGEKGFDKRVWDGEPIKTQKGPGLKLKYVSQDGEEGYPGRLKTVVKYVLTHSNNLNIQIQATTDRPTIVNITNHNYYNLTGEEEKVTTHRIAINANHFTPIDSDSLPTGEILPVEGTPFDLREKVKIGDRIASDHPQIELGRGYNHNFVLNRETDGQDWSALISAPSTGISMKLVTDLPCLQCYTGGALKTEAKGKKGNTYDPYRGISLEPQHFIDAPNHASFPAPVLEPDETYKANIRLELNTTEETQG